MKRKRISNKLQDSWRWLAGFIDGEGCISIRMSKSRNRKLSPRITINNTCLQALEFIKDGIGGRISQGRIRVPGYKKSYMWEATQEELINTILENTLPFLKIKYLQAEQLLAFPRNRTNRPNPKIKVKQLAIYASVKELNKTGRRKNE